MSNSAASRATRVAALNLGVEFGLGCLYWLAFLLLLQPGNLFEMTRSGVRAAWAEEMLRIAGAAVLGGVVTPLLFRLSRRFPIEGRRWRRHAVIHGAVVLMLALGLIILAHTLAGPLLPGRDPRLLAPLSVEIASNGALLFLVLAAFVAVVHAARFFRRAEAERAAAAEATKRKAASSGRVPVRTHGGVTFVALEHVDWIESQGNYLALHVGSQTHLIRDTLAKFERRLDPEIFVRIHRGTVVRADRVGSLTHLSNGDAAVTLHDGTKLRLSRSYRASARTLMEKGEMGLSAAQPIQSDPPPG